jgi:iron(III) transport system permease protein
MSDAVLGERLEAPGPRRGRPRGMPVVPRPSREGRLMQAGLLAGVLFLLLALAVPLLAFLLRGASGGDLAELRTLPGAAWNSLWTAVAIVLAVLPLAFGYAYALARACIPFRPFFRAVLPLPLLAPALLPALALQPLWGEIRGPWAIVAAQALALFPVAALILSVALTGIDGRLREAAETLRAGRLRILLTVTLPAARHGIAAAAGATFALAVTEPGIPLLLGGEFRTLASDLHDRVMGGADRGPAAVAGLLLLLPALAAFALQRWAEGRAAATLGGGATPRMPRPRAARDLPLLLLCLGVAAPLLGVPAAALLTAAGDGGLRELLRMAGGEGWRSLGTSVVMAALAATAGSAIAFLLAWLREAAPRDGAGRVLREAMGLLAILPLAVPGLVLGLSYLLLLGGPAGAWHGTLAVLVLACVVQSYAVAHLAAATAIRQLDPEFEAVGASLKVPAVVTFRRVTLPVCAPALLETWSFLFVAAMTGIGAVVLLHGPGTTPAAVAALRLAQAGEAAPAAALCCMVLAVTTAVKLAQLATSRKLDRTTGAWCRG